MARIGDNILTGGVELSVDLDRYQEIMRLPINAFNGINKSDEEGASFDCNTIWRQRDRDYLATFLAVAQEKREEELGYHIAPVYKEEEDFLFKTPLIFPPPSKHLKQIGKKVTTTIVDAQALTLGDQAAPNDPVSFTVTVDFTDTSLLKVFYPDEDIEINPSSVSISGTTATVEIPRARLVDNDFNDDRDDHLDYYINANFITTVDVKKVTFDEPTGVVYIWIDTNGNEVTQVSRPIIDNLKLAIVQIIPATYDTTTELWTATSYRVVSGSTVFPTFARVSYVSGRESNMSVELDTCRLAHTLMPHKPIDCEAVAQYWLNDRTPDPSRVTTPYGNSVGAVNTWISDSRAKVGIGGKF